MTNIPDFQKGVPFDGTSGLLPAIAQDSVTGRILMMAWMDQQAWQETLSSGAAVYLVVCFSFEKNGRALYGRTI